MSVVIVSRGSDLAFALGTRTETVGVAPEDLERYLQDDPDVTGAVVDVGSAQADITRAVDAFRSRLLACPIVVVAAQDAVPAGYVDISRPLALLTRPFTMERLLDRLLRVRETASPAEPHEVPVPEADAVPGDATHPELEPEPAPLTKAEPELAPQPAPVPELAPEPQPAPRLQPSPEGEPPAPVEVRSPEPGAVITESFAETPVAAPAPPAESRRRLFGRRPPPAPAAAAAPSATTLAIRLLAAAELRSVSEVAESLLAQLDQEISEGLAVMVLDDAGWRVAASRGLRAIEMRGVLERGHWLAQQLETEQSAVIVSGTDLVRQDLRGVPLIHHEQWMAITLAQAPAILVRGREGETPYTLDDALASRDQASALGPQLLAAIELRGLARHLAAYRDRPE